MNINKNNPHLTKSALSWLSDILYERFNLNIILELLDNKIILKIDELKGYIAFCIESSYFYNKEIELSCFNWKPSSEGFSSQIEDYIPAPGLLDLKGKLIVVEGLNYHFNYDILGLIFWMFTRYEEIEAKNLDKHFRFKATYSHAYKYNYLERPIVDEWLNILEQVIQKQWPQTKIKKNIFEMKVSHDVDSPSRYWFISFKQLIVRMGAEILKRGNIINALYAPWIYFNSGKLLHSKDPSNTFDWIMKISEENNLKSAFYFISGRTEPKLDAVYEIEHEAIRKLMGEIHSRGHEIGLHPSYNTYLNNEALSKELIRLKNVCKEEKIFQNTWGGRMHVLRWEQPKTMNVLEKAKLDYDTTMTYPDRAGFRSGTCFEYPAFDPISDNKLNLRIRPLIAMEGTIIYDRYMGLGTGEYAFKKLKELKDKCRKVGGCFTLLWHNSEFITNDYRELYVKIIKA